MKTLFFVQITALTMSLFTWSQFNERNNTSFALENDFIVKPTDEDALSKGVTVTLGNITDSVATIDELIQVKSLTIHLPSEKAKQSSTYSIESYNLSYFENDKWNEIHTTGSGVTSEMKEAIGRAKPGSKLYFERIIMKSPDGVSHKMAGIGIRVK